jgi:DNA-binding transcriptional LysR family regulator
MFELNQLRCFVTVAEMLHFRRAAAHLNMTQPPLSRQIQLLEQEVGAVLLDRSTRRVRLTPAGQVFLRAARQMLQAAENAARDARRVARGESGEITIAFTATSSYAYLPRLVSVIRARMPELELTLREMVSSAQLDALQAGAIDFALCRPPVARAGLRAVRVHREPLLLAVPGDHPLAEKASINIDDVSGEPLITYPPIEGRYFHDLVASLYHVAGIAPSRVQYITQAHSIMALVGAGIGIAVVPQAAERLQQAGVVLRPLQSAANATADLMFALRINTENPAVAAVEAMLEQEWPALGYVGGKDVSDIGRGRGSAV